jgi:hypothetical protein
MIVDVSTYYPLKKGHEGQVVSGKNGEGFRKGESYYSFCESYSFSQFAEAGSTTPFCHPEKMHETFNTLQKGARIMNLHEHQWTLMVVEQIESKWYETRTMNRHHNTEDSRSEFEYVTQEFFYKFRCKDEIFMISFSDVDVKIKADQMRPLVSPQGQFPAVWFYNQWENTSDIPCLHDKTKETLSSLVENIKESSEFITASHKFEII